MTTREINDKYFQMNSYILDILGNARNLIVNQKVLLLSDLELKNLLLSDIDLILKSQNKLKLNIN